MAKQYKFSTAVNKIKNKDNGISSFGEAVDFIRSNKNNNNYLTEIDRENRHRAIEEGEKKARLKAIELAKANGTTSQSQSNAGNDRTTALRQNTNPYGLPVYKGLNTAENGADVAKDKFNTEAATQNGYKGLIGTKSQEQTISKEQSLAHANEVYAPFKDNQEVTDLFNQYVDAADKLETDRMTGNSGYSKYRSVRAKQKLEKQIRDMTGLSADDFKQVAENYTYLRHDEQRTEQQAELDEASGLKKAALTAVNIPTAAIGNYYAALGSLKKPNDPELGRDYNSAEFYLSNLNKDTKEAVHTDIDESTMADYQKALAGFGYDAFTMGTESAASQLLGGAGLASFFAGGYASSLEEAEQRGLTRGQAQGYALVSGGLEYATEKIPFDNLKNIFKGKAVGKEAVKGSLMPYVKALFKQAKEEATEEVINGVGDILADALINSDKSKINIAIQNYMQEEGLSEEEATRKAFFDEGKDILYAAASAAVSAGASAGPALAVQAYDTTKAGRNIADYENKTGNLTRNVENENYIPETRENYVADEDYRQAQETRQAILAASEKAAKNERLTGKEARALAESYSKTAENLNTAQKVESTKLIEGFKAKAEEKAVEQIKNASTPAEVETIKEEHIDSDTVKAAVEEKKTEMIEAGEATEKDFTEAITPTKAATMAENGKTIAPEVLEQLPEKVKQAYETGNADQANKLTSAASKADITTVKYANSEGATTQTEIKSVSQNNSGELVLELSNGETVKAAEAQFSDKGKYIYNSPNGINSLANPVLAQIAFDIEMNSKHGVAIGYVTNSLKDMYTIGASGLSFDEAIKSKKYDVSTLGKDMLKAAYEEGKKHSSATSRATAAKKGKGLIREATEENSADYKRQFADEATQNEYENQLSESNKKFLELFSRKIGVDIAFFNENSQDRGSYRPDEGKIYLNLYHSHNMFNVALHEGIGEFMAASNEKAYNAIVDSVLNAYAATNSTKLAKDIRAYQSAYEGDTYGGTYRGAAQELFNDALSSMFSSEENMQKMFNWMAANEGVQQAEKVKKTLVDYLKSVKDTIHDVLTKGVASTVEERKLKLSEKEASTYVNQILKAMDQAIANRDAEAVEQGESAPRKSLSSEQLANLTKEDRENYWNFYKVLEDYNKNKNINKDLLVMTYTPKILQDIGLRDLPIYMSKDHYNDITHAPDPNNDKYHGLTMQEVAEAPIILNNPALIVDSISKNDSIVIIANSLDYDNRPIVISVKSDGNALQVVDSNYLTSMYGRNNFDSWLDRIIQKKYVLYVSKNKSQEMISRLGVQFPASFSSLSFDTIIHPSVNAVNGISDKNKKKSQQAKKNNSGGHSYAVDTEFQVQEVARHSFAGIGAETADMHQLNIASDMMDEGIDEETILASTGWFKGLDNKWKFEIPDNDLVIFKDGNAKFLYGNPDFKRYNELMDKIFFKGDVYTDEEFEELGELEEKVLLKTQDYGNLSDFIKHDKLFNAYPFLYGTYIDFVDFGNENVKGAADIKNNGIHLNENFHKSVSGSFSEGAMKSTLLHEIQHLIQQFEDFANGASPAWWADIKQERIEADEKNLVGAKEYLNRAIEDARQRGLPTSVEDYIFDLSEQLDSNEITLDEYRKEIAKFKKSKVYHYTDMVRKLERHLRKLRNDSNELLYWNTAGEIEARDVQTRMSLTEQERREKLPKNYDSDVVYTEGTTAQRRYSIQVDTEGRSLSKDQQEYFKDSKVVDEEGRLRVVYHGTMAEFNIFDLKEARDTEDIEAFFFSGDYDESSGYGNVGEYYLNITNPADYDTAYDIFFKYKGKEHAGRLAREELQSMGYDGVIAVDEDSPEYTEYLVFDSKQIKKVDNKKPTDNPDIRKSIKVDSEGRNIAPGMQQYLKDNAGVFFDKNGAVKNYYHGSRYAGFTAFNLEKMDDERSIFLTDNEGVAKTYAGTSEKFEPDRKWSFKELKEAISLFTDGDWEVEQNDSGVVITESGFIGEEGTSTTFNSIKEAQDYLINWMQQQDRAENGGVYDVYVHSTNPLVIDARNQRWDEIEPWEYDKHLVDVNITRNDDVYEVDYANVEGEYFHQTYNSREEFEQNFSVLPEDYDIPDEGEYYEDLYLDKDKNIIPTNTRAMSAYAKENGYDSLVINNVVDSGLFGSTSEQNLTSQVVVVFNPNQVKSIYNPNPTASEDIRYSKSVDSDGNRLSVQQKEMFKDSKAVDKKGNLLVLYHGSQSADRFNTFDMNTRGIVNGRAFGDGFYFTPYRDVADFWGEKNLYKVYLNLTNPYYANKSSRVPKDVKKLIKDRYTESLSSKRDVNGAYRAEVKNAYDALEVLWRYGKINDLKTLGYDGVIFDDKDVAKYSVQYVAFNPEQIKETTNLNPTQEAKDIRYSISVGEDRIHTYKGIEIIQNPTNKEYQQMRADIIKERPWMDGPDTILLRHTYDEEGNEYYWDAYAGMHFEIEPVIAEHWKTRVNQQWEWWKDDDKDFWANRSFRRYSKAVFGEESQYSSQLEQTQFVSQILSTLNNQLKGTTVSMKYLDDTVKYILDKYDADLNPDDLKMELSEFIAYMTANEQVDYNQMMNYLLNVGDEVIQASRLKDPEEERIYSELKKELSSHKINLTEMERKELISKYGGSWNAVFGKLNAAGIKLNNTGQHMDGSTYAEIVDKFRTIAGVQLDEETTAVDQIATILDAMEVLKPSAYQWEGATDMDKALDVATTIIDRYYSMATAIKEANIVKGTEKGAAAVERAKKNEIKKLRAKQEEYKAKVNEEFQQLVEDRKKVIQEQQEFYKRQAEIEKNFRGEKREFNKKANMSAKELEKTAKLQAQMQYQGLKDTEAKRKHKDNIVRTSMRLINWMNKPTDTRHVPTFLKPALSDMIKSINFMPASMRRGEDGTISAMKWQESMRKLQQVLQGISNADAESLNDSDKYELSLVMEVDEIVNKMQQLLDKYGGIADISRMSKEDLKVLSDIMTSISKGISQMNENFMNRRFKHVSEAAKASIDEMKLLKPISNSMGVVKSTLSDFLNLDMAEPITFFEELGSASESIMQEFFDGEKIGIEIIEEADKYFEKIAKDLGLSTKDLRAWENDAKEYKYGGVPITLTSADLMSLYCSYNREKLDQEERPFEATHHIAAGGIKGFRHKIGFKEVNRNPQVAHVTEADVLRLLDNLTETQKKYADLVVSYMSNELAAHGNKTSNKLNGYSKFLGKYYFPLKTDNNAIATTESNNTSDQAAFRRLIFPSFTKSQIDKADNALVIMNFFDVVTEHITGMSNYCAYAMPISDAMRWYNYAETERANTEVEDQYQRYTTSVKGSLDRVRGDEARKYFENFIRDVNLDNKPSGSKASRLIAQGLTGLAKAKAVGLNIRVIVQQPCAIIRAADVIEGKYLAEGWNKMSKNPKAATEYAQSESYLCYWKSKGFSDTRVSQSMKEIITGQESLRQDIVEKTGVLAGLADDVTWAAMYYAAEAKIEATTDLQKGTEEFHTAVEELFSDIINHTQVIDSQLRKTGTMRSKSELEMLANAFKKEPQKSYNMLHRAYWKVYQNPTSAEAKKEWHRAVTIFAENAFVTAIAQSLVDAWRDDDDEDSYLIKMLKKMLPYDSYATVRDFVSDIMSGDVKAKDVLGLVQGIYGGAGNILDNANIASSVPYVADLDSLLKGYSVTRLDSTSILTQLKNTVTTLGSTNATAYSILYSLAQLVGYGTGIGVDNALRDLRGIYNQFLSDITGVRIEKNAATAKKNAKKKETNRVSEVFDSNDLSSIKAEIQTAYEKGVESSKDGSESDGWSAARNMLKEQYQRILAEHPEEKVSLNNRFKSLLKYTKKANGKGGYRTLTDKEIQNYIDNWSAAE